MIAPLPEQTFGRVDAQLVARKRQRHRAAAAVAKLKISAACAFCIFLAQRAERGAYLVKIRSAGEQLRKGLPLRVAENIPVLLVIARHLVAGEHIAVRRDGDHAAVSLAHGRTAPVLSRAGVDRGERVKPRARIERPELPDCQVHRVLALRVFLPQEERLVIVFLKREAGVARVLHPAGGLRCADDAHFRHAHAVQTLRRFQHGIAVAAIHIRLHLDGEAVFDAQPDRAQRSFLRALVCAHPIVIAEAVKGYFHERDAADGLHAVKRLPVDKIPIRVQLLDVHAARVDALENLEEALVQHRLAARDGEGVDAAVAGLVEKPVRLVHAPLAHERRIVGGIEAVDAVIVAFARDHPVHRWEIAVRTEARPAPVRQHVAVFGLSDEAVCQEFAGQRAFRLVRQLASPVALRQKRKLLRRQALSVALALDVIRIGNEHPRTQGDIGVQNITHSLCLNPFIGPCYCKAKALFQ